jgi:hypothetical protein
MSVKELEKAISKLSSSDFAKFSNWFDEFRAELWDREFETDVKAGKLNALGEEADRDFEAGRCKPI